MADISDRYVVTAFQPGSGLKTYVYLKQPVASTMAIATTLAYKSIFFKSIQWLSFVFFCSFCLGAGVCRKSHKAVR